MAEIIRYQTPVFRASFPKFYKPEAGPDGGAEKYGVSAVWTPEHFTDREKDLWQKLLKATDEECKTRFKKGYKDLKALVAEGGVHKLVPRNGATKTLEGYGPGTQFASLTTKMRPGLIDARKRPIYSKFNEEDMAKVEKLVAEGKEEDVDFLVDEGSTVYAGCYMRATVSVYSYDNKGKGVAWGLMNVQKVKDGDRLDSRIDAAEDFEDDLEDMSDDTSDFLDG